MTHIANNKLYESNIPHVENMDTLWYYIHVYVLQASVKEVL